MTYSWDETKRASNFIKHGIDFEAVASFEWALAQIQSDVRHDEPRLIATGPIGTRIYVVVFTIETRTTRIISLRRASQKERDRYVTAAV